MEGRHRRSIKNEFPNKQDVSKYESLMPTPPTRSAQMSTSIGGGCEGPSPVDRPYTPTSGTNDVPRTSETSYAPVKVK